MNAIKYDVTIRVQCLSLEVVRGLVSEAVSQIGAEVTKGELSHDDGDAVDWSVARMPVTF